MRFIVLLVICLASYAEEFPQIFSEVGDGIYENMQRFEKIKALKIYKDRPELLDAFCIDANSTMQEGLNIEALKNDPEVILPKQRIRDYAKRLRVLSKKNDAIMGQLDRDVNVLREAKDYETLEKIQAAGFILSEEIRKEISTAKQEKSVETLRSEAGEKQPVIQEKTVAQPVQGVIPPSTQSVDQHVPEVIPPKKPLTELEKYQLSLANMKEELYALRESSDQTQVACMNDITAINYWMIRVLENEREPCARADAIKQMKSYAKASSLSCGRNSIRYAEWQGRIKPYVGMALFQAEADCHQ